MIVESNQVVLLSWIVLIRCLGLSLGSRLALALRRVRVPVVRRGSRGWRGIRRIAAIRVRIVAIIRTVAAVIWVSVIAVVRIRADSEVEARPPITAAIVPATETASDA